MGGRRGRGARRASECSTSVPRPGGKATAIAAERCLRRSRRRAPAPGVAGRRQRRSARRSMSSPSSPMRARPPFRRRWFDAVLIDAPCSGLGALRRRPDARWRIRPDDVGELAAAAAPDPRVAAALVRPGGRLVYSVCTLTAAESIDHPMPDGFEIDARVRRPARGDRTRHGWRVLPHDADTDGMVLIRYRRHGMSDDQRLHAKVLTVSDGVIHGTRDDTRRRGARRPARRRRLRRRRAPRHGRRRRRRGGGAERDERRLRRADRDDRRHGVRASRPDARGRHAR